MHSKTDSEPVSRVLYSPLRGCLPFIYGQRRRCPLSFYPPARTGRPLFLRQAQDKFAGLHELSTPGVHSADITADLVGSYPTFSPLPHGRGGYFLLHLLTLADLFLLGSGMPCVARTFLPSVAAFASLLRAAASRFTVCFWGTKVQII